MCDNVSYYSYHDLEIMKSELKNQIEKQVRQEIKEQVEQRVYQTYGLEINVL
jgi:DNA-directed RNA polymerase subunit E'/Rpb7